jgi:tetratricopeptide (TPR) repeat protein
MILAPLALLAQTLQAATAPAGSPEQARLTLCLEQARTDPATAIDTAGLWLKEAHDTGRALPQQCLGQAYVSLLRWDAAQAAFRAARDAALAGNDFAAALADLDAAASEAGQAGDNPLAGSILSDKARALVGLKRDAEAAAALQQARQDAPQDAEVWLLSATLSRRLGDLKSAQAQIETAGALAPKDPAVGLEAGVIAELAGNDAAARKSWNSVVALGPDTPEAQAAKGYLAETGGAGQ